MDLGNAWDWCQRAEKILACREGSLEERCRAAFREALAHAKPYLPDNYLAELRSIEQDLAEGRPLSTEEAHTVAQGIVYIANGISFRYAVEDVAAKRMQEGDGPRPLPRPPSTN
jgi:hypothetical protein